MKEIKEFTGGRIRPLGEPEPFFNPDLNTMIEHPENLNTPGKLKFGFDFDLQRQMDDERDVLADARRKKEPILRRIEELQAELRGIDARAQAKIDSRRDFRKR